MGLNSNFPGQCLQLIRFGRLLMPMLRDEDVTVQRGRATRGDFLVVTHLPSGISRRKDPPLGPRSSQRAFEKQARREIEAELREKSGLISAPSFEPRSKQSEQEAAAHEDAFVKCFIEKDRRDRLLFELRERRADFLDRFCHDARSYLDPRFVVPLKPPNSDPKQILQLLTGRGAGKVCYAISASAELDGRFLRLVDALEVAVGFGMPSIISCVAGELAYLETEQECGPPERFLLARPGTTRRRGQQ